MSKTIEEILALKPEARPRIYAYSIADAAHKGLEGFVRRHKGRAVRAEDELSLIRELHIVTELDVRGEVVSSGELFEQVDIIHPYSGITTEGHSAAPHARQEEIFGQVAYLEPRLCQIVPYKLVQEALHG